jgi:hypothetical protein
MPEDPDRDLFKGESTRQGSASRALGHNFLANIRPLHLRYVPVCIRSPFAVWKGLWVPAVPFHVDNLSPRCSKSDRRHPISAAIKARSSFATSDS